MASKAKNPFTWVEIYVDDLQRAKKFYETVLDVKLVELPLTEEMVDIEMLSFPGVENGENISGALVKSQTTRPGPGGTIVYFTCDDCSVEESRVESAGGKVLDPKMSLGDYGYCSMILDTEGNSIGLHSMQ